MHNNNALDSIRKSDPDFYYEHLHENPNEYHDSAKTKSKLKPHEIAELKKSDDYWENARLKAWGERFKEAKRKRGSSSEDFEYLL